VTDPAARRNRIVLFAACFAAILLAGCSKKEAPAPKSETPATTASQPAAAPAAAQSAAENVTLPAPFGKSTDDLDAMLKRRNIRAIVIMNPIGFFYDKGHPMGAMFEALREFESFVNKKYKTGTMQVKVSFIPMRPDQVEAALQQGVGDVVAYGMVVTPEREQRFAFTVPIQTNVQQVVVSGKGFGDVANLDALGGKQLWLNPITVNYQHVQQLNERLKKEGKPLIDLKAADEHLLEDDLIQMVNAGLLPATVVSLSRAKLWSQVLPNVVPHPDLVIASGENLAWGVRKNNPQFKALLDEFIPSHAVGTSFGNTLARRYLQNTKFVKDNTSAQEMAKFNSTAELFKKYAGQYGFDYLMIVAQGYQESLLDQKKRNPSGAVGIMQVIPKNAAANPINVKNVSDAEGNIEAGVKMLRDIEDRYFNDPAIDPVDKTLMVFASYNAGPNRIARLRKEAASRGLDPNKWFNNVELMVAEDIGQETVTYVSNIYKYYVAYKLAVKQDKLKG
jgi:membrane-bound lytic murein transglycosylase MltF